MNTGTSFNGKISFTADGVAYRRTFTDIPYSKEIFEILKQHGGMIDPKEKQRADAMPQLIPMFEARYLLTDQELKKSGIKQVLELASGLSPRGFIWADDLDVQYVEIDLPEKMAMKRTVVNELHCLNGTNGYDNLHLLEGNITLRQDILDSNIYLEHEPLFVICEGLLRYLNWRDKSSLALAVRDTIHLHGGGIWTTPDIELLSDVNATPESTARYDMMAREWGFDVRPNLFKDMGHAVEFFEAFGFKVNQHCQLEMIDQLVSPKRLGLPDENVRQQLGMRTSFVMTL